MRCRLCPNDGITFSREDASNLAQAKAANYCGQMIVLRKFGINPRDITKLYLAGGFANYVNVRNAIEIGFLAPVPEDRIVKIGNASVQGAKEVLLSRRKRQAVESSGEADRACRAGNDTGLFRSVRGRLPVQAHAGSLRSGNAHAAAGLVGFCREKLPSLDKEGKPWPQATAGVVRTVAEKSNQ